MKKSLLFIVAIAFASILTSCKGPQQVLSYKTMGISEIGVIQHPVLAELDVNKQKLTQTVTVKKAKLPGVVEATALALVAKEIGADVIVEPKFEFKNKMTKVEVTVTGYPATYKSFRSMTSDDDYILEHMRWRQAEVKEGRMLMQPKRGRR